MNNLLVVKGKFAVLEALVNNNINALLYLLRVYFVQDRKMTELDTNNTFRTYQTAIIHFCSWWGETFGSMKVAFGKPELDKYYSDCLARKASPATLRVRLAAIKVLAEALTYHGYPVEFPKVRRAKEHSGPKRFPLHWETFVRAYATIKSPRTRAMVALAGFAGLRCSEICNLKWSRVLSDNLVIERAKGGKTRVVPLSTRAKEALKQWKMESTGVSEYVFPSQETGGPLCRTLVGKAIRTWERKVSLPTGVHILRHTFATRVYNQQGDIRLVQELLGHEDLNTTRIYTKVGNDRLSNAIANL